MQGEITVCEEGFASGCNFTRSGSLDGMTVTQADWLSTGGTYLADVGVAYADGMIIRFLAENYFENAGTVANAFVIGPPGPPFNGAIYCAGTGSAFVGPYNGQRVYTLTNFSRVGSCTGITGSNEVSGCLVGYP